MEISNLKQFGVQSCRWLLSMAHHVPCIGDDLFVSRSQWLHTSSLFDSMLHHLQRIKKSIYIRCWQAYWNLIESRKLMRTFFQWLLNYVSHTRANTHSARQTHHHKFRHVSLCPDAEKCSNWRRCMQMEWKRMWKKTHVIAYKSFVAQRVEDESKKKRNESNGWMKR